MKLSIAEGDYRHLQTVVISRQSVHMKSIIKKGNNVLYMKIINFEVKVNISKYVWVSLLKLSCRL